MTARTLVLASTSPYRSELLSRLGIPFTTASPDVDESPLKNETAKETSIRLSRSKALAVASSFPDALIIGSDQVALLGSQQIGKPGNHLNAQAQLKSMRGQTISFHTAISLLNTASKAIQTDVAICEVTYRDYSDTEIENYLSREQPYNCAGSIKSEGLGIAMLSRIASDDPSALIGLPLILLVDMLKKENYNIL